VLRGREDDKEEALIDKDNCLFTFLN